MKRTPEPAPEKDLETQLRDAYLADDPEAAWFLDRAEPRVVRVSHGATNIPDLTAQGVEDDEERYAELPVLTDSELHEWMEDFVAESPDPKVAQLLDERLGANKRFIARLAETHPDAFAQWKAFHAARVASALAAWREGL
jgi:hypothetical protein